MLALETAAADETERHVPLRDLIDALPHEVAIVDPHGVVKVVNALWRSAGPFCARVGALAPGDNALEVLRAAAARGDDVAGRLAEGLARALAGASAFHLDYGLDGDARARWFSLDIRALPEARQGALLCRSDVTTQSLRFAGALDASENRERRGGAELQAILDAAPIGLAIALDPQAKHIRGNPALEQFTGAPRGGELSKSAEETTPYRVFKDGREARLHELPMQRAVRGESVSGDVLEILGADGRRRTALATARPLYDEGGNPCGAVGAFTDITRIRRAEDALRESEQRFRRLIEAYAQAVWETDAAGKGVADSPSWRDYSGQSASEWRERGWLAAVHPDDRTAALQRWRDAVDRGDRFDVEVRLRDKSGGWRWSNLRATPVCRPDGAVAKWTGMTVDIDARKRAEDALRASEERYRTLFEKMDEGFCIIDAMLNTSEKMVDCRIVEANPAFAKHTGLINVVGRTIGELTGGAASRWAAFFADVARTGRAARIEDYSQALGRWMDVSAFPIGAPEANRVAALCTDVTARRRADERLRESEAQFRAIFELTGVGMAQAETKTRRLVRVNDTLAQMLGYSREELIGKPFPELTHPDDREADLQRFLRMARGETDIYQSEKRYLRKDGSSFWAHVTATIAGSVSDPESRTVAVIQDVDARRLMETQLRESEARLEQALEAANAGVWELSSTPGAFKMSPRTRALFGAPADAPEDRASALAALVAGDRERFESALALALQAKRPLKVDMRVRDAKGATRWIHAAAEPRGEGESLRLVGLVQDIDEVKRNEIALRDSEFRLQLALGSGNIGIYEWRLSDGDFMWDDRLLAQWGLPPGATMTYETFLDGAHPDDRQRVEDEIGRALDPAAGGAFRSEFRVIGRSDRVERWMAVTGTAFFEDGRAIRMVGTAQDVTARKHAEFERQKFVSLAEQSVEFIGICNLAFEPLYINPAGLRLVGLPSVEAGMQVNVGDFFFPEDRDFLFGEFFPKVLRDGHANVEIRFRRFDTGDTLWMLYNVFFLRDALGTPIGLATVSRDITQRKYAEEALKDADRRKDEFLATLAHELRNPLSPIRNAAHVLRHDADLAAWPARDVALLSMIDRQSEHLVRLVDDLLEVSRITRGKIELRMQRVDLASILRHAVETAQPTIAAGRHRLDVRLPSEALTLEADPVRLAQVFTNLLNNAAKYTEQGGVISLVAAREGDEAVVTVRDNGVGIPQDMLPHVFDLFTQIDRTLGRAQGGLGIGLALVKRLVELHGGAVEAHSDGLGRGSAFVVRLRLFAENGAKAPMSTVVTNDLPVSRRILVIDDDHDVADSLVMFLETFGADVHVAYSGESGVAAVREFRPELIFLDLGMPKMDGYETARRIRALPEGREVKLVALTGWGQGQIRDRAQDAGFDCQLTKPAGIDALQALLNTI